VSDALPVVNHPEPQRVGARMAAFHALSAEEQVRAIRAMAENGYGLSTMAQACGVSVEQIRRVLTEPQEAG
jgi:hypothetical protein